MKVYIAIAILLIPNLIFSQEEKKNLFYGRSRLNEPSFGYERKVSTKIGLAVEAGYRFRLTKEADIDNSVFGYGFEYWWMIKAFRGLSVKPFIVNFYNKDGYNQFSIATTYKYLKADKLIFDSGKSGGANTSDYAEFSQTNHELGVNIFLYRSFQKYPAFNWYLEIGGLYRSMERHYTIEGSFANQYPSDKVEYLHSKFFSPSIAIIPSLHVGLKIDLAKF